MAYVQSAVSPRDVQQNASRAERNWLGRVFDALERAGARQAERDLVRRLVSKP